MNKIVIILCILVICVIILGVVNKRSIEDITLCVIVVMLLMGVLWFFNKIMS